jgi:cobalt-zinc-cadmium efflux system membrane fusion protein
MIAKPTLPGALAPVCTLLLALGPLSPAMPARATPGDVSATPPQAPAAPPARQDADSVTLSDSQLRAISIARATERDFPVERHALGTVDFNENRTTSVFAPYAGRIVATHADLGDEVHKGEVLFSLDSPDFIAAQSTLISAAATFEQTSSALDRAHALYANKSIDQNDYETALANQHSAEGALHAARRALALFGVSDGETARIESTRKVEPALLVRSPLDGRITARNAAPGLYLEPGNPPAPFTVADLSSVWLVAQVVESDAPLFRVGQPLRVSVSAYPQKVFTGHVTAMGSALDANTRRRTVRAEIHDPKHELLQNMFADFVIAVGPPVHGVAVPVNSVVREGDGTLSVWVAGSDRHRFTRRTVQVGLTHDGFEQILGGVSSGENVAATGAIFLSNILFGGAS